MKKLLLLILVCFALNSSAQTIIKLDTASAACKIDSITFAANYLNYKLNGSTAIDVTIVGNSKQYINASYTRFRKPDNSTFATRNELTAWIDKYFFVNASGSGQGIGGFVGGHALMEGDGVATVFTITTNAGFIPSYFTLTTTTPITQNQLNRSITFPTDSTMVITFQNAPLEGEDTDYVYILFK